MCSTDSRLQNLRASCLLLVQAVPLQSTVDRVRGLKRGFRLLSIRNLREARSLQRHNTALGIALRPSVSARPGSRRLRHWTFALRSDARAAGAEAPEATSLDAVFMKRSIACMRLRFRALGMPKGAEFSIGLVGCGLRHPCKITWMLEMIRSDFVKDIQCAQEVMAQNCLNGK